ncbi:MAG TPA: hypothetical protein VGW35_24790 [Methylomirabilota bacterium]|jgi:hypothetical protein|nr:hypothetical protein [Methylomirabilota bacterium]
MLSYLAEELAALDPVAVVTLGGAAYRAVIRALGLDQAGRGGGVPLTVPPAAARVEDAGLAVTASRRPFRLFAGPFIRGRHRAEAARALRRAARLAGVLER